jgi:hypothetical protein
MISRSHRNFTSILLRRRIVESASPNLSPRRFLTSASAKASTTSQATTSPRLVVSRRAWNALKDSLPPKPPPVAKPKAEEKPWPQSVRVAGYVAGGVLVPYIAIWWITSNPTLRRWIGPYLPMDKLRSHFGHLEWNVQSYVDEMQLDNSYQSDTIIVEKPQPNVEYYQFPEESPLKERQQQEIIDALNSSKIQTKITVFSSSSQDSVTLTLPASTPATMEHFMSVVKGSLSGTSKATVAVDFDDDEDNSDENAATNVLLSDNDAAATALDPNPATSLLKATQTFSKWFYISSQQQQQQAGDSSSGSTSSETDVNISRLEYTIAELQKSLKDPTGTRDMDEMAAELKQAKRELSGLKWKRRLGLSS